MCVVIPSAHNALSIPPETQTEEKGDKTSGPFHGRAEIKGATVRLHKVTQKDAGKYRCEVTAPKDHVSLGEVNVTLTVLVPPQAPSCDVPSSALTGSLVQLRCRDHHSIPAAVYTWYKDNKPLAIKKPNATYTIDEKTGVLNCHTQDTEEASGFQAHSVVHAVMKQTDDDCCDTGATQSSGHQKTRRVHQSTERTPVTPMP
ncbi:hypothetical protein cypCar_00034405 [Cyprinus carpio]|nr:hypothetical protein cypCar_00034405 [Cyprinus carpio]